MVSSQSHKLKVLLGNKEYEIVVDETHSLLLNLLKNDIHVDNLCGGKGLCGKCAVRVIDGKFSPPTNAERPWIEILGSDMRLSCQVVVLSDGIIELKKAKTTDGKILTWGIEKGFRINPLVTFRKLKLDPPTLQDQMGDLERLLEASGMRNYDPLILREISDLLRKSDFEVNIIEYEEEIVDLTPAREDPIILGASVDIGTTTVVIYLYDLLTGRRLDVESAYNEQLKFGEDIISRVEYAKKSRDNLEALKRAVVSTINELLEKILQKNNLKSTYIYDMVCAGNTTMLSFLLGNDCSYGSIAPYPPPFTSSVKIKARDLGIGINPKGYVRTVPSISMYIGGDIVADIIASEFHKSEHNAALIDLGTNGEVVIKTNDDQFLAASCAAGPALEGYGVRNGMRAVKGAIESVIIDEDGRSYYRVIGNTRPEGICGSGIIEAIAWMRIRGIIDESGRIIEGSSRWVSRDSDGLKFIIVPADASATGKEISLTQKDIRKIQLAKAAIYAAILTLTRFAGLKMNELERVFIAGAFGNYLDIFAAQVLGMLPDLPQDKFLFIGNGAIVGASIILLSRESAEEARAIASKVKIVELNTVKYFQNEFIKATYIPHMERERFENVLRNIEKIRKISKKMLQA
ncbi:MAG: ASKHA domain-containing protein [Nitrososphaerota archaeon]